MPRTVRAGAASAPVAAVAPAPDSDRPTMVLANPFNAETPRPALEAERTPTEAFFVRSHFATPKIDPDRWRLRLFGLVDRPRAWSYAELARMPQRRATLTIECAGNGRDAFPEPADGELRWGEGAVGTARWEGVPLSALLELAGPGPRAKELVFTGADRARPGTTTGPRRFARSLALEDSRTLGETLVALRMNDRPLTPEHGFPARLVVPGWYGMAWVKWLSSIAVRATPFRGHFQSVKYVYRDRAAIAPHPRPVSWSRVKSLIVHPVPGAVLRRGRPVRLRGRAWSGAARIRSVEVDVGDGWRPAAVVSGPALGAWSTWMYDWVPAHAGPAILRSRATDASGEAQPDRPYENEFQYGSNAVRSVGVIVR